MANRWAEVVKPSEAIAELQQTVDDLFAELQRGDHIKGIAQDAVELVRDQTYQGLKARGGKQRPYSPKWKLVRQEAGLPTHVVTLWFSGTMLSALGSKVKDWRTAILYVQPLPGPPRGVTRDIVARGQQERGRAFIGLSKANKARLANAVKGRLIQAMITRVNAVRPDGQALPFLAGNWRIGTTNFAKWPRGKYPERRRRS